MKSSTEPSWWRRNWKWVVPVGCLGGLLFASLWVVGLATVIFVGMRSTGAYQQAMTLVRQDARVREALGTPIEAGWFIWGSVSVTGGSGEADLAIPIEGSVGSGTVYVVATKLAGRWRFEVLEVAVEGREERIDLLRAGDRQGGTSTLGRPPPLGPDAPRLTIYNVVGRCLVTQVWYYDKKARFLRRKEFVGVIEGVHEHRFLVVQVKGKPLKLYVPFRTGNIFVAPPEASMWATKEHPEGPELATAWVVNWKNDLQIGKFFGYVDSTWIPTEFRTSGLQFDRGGESPAR